MADVLENKRSATRFRILVEIADRQPAVSQGEIADAVGVTSQAVSEYIRELTEMEYVSKEGRSNYRVTKEGVDWLLQSATEVREFADRVTDDVLGSVQEDVAIASGPVEAGQTVTLRLKRGLLHADPGDAGPATGVATTAGAAGEDIGVTEFEGIIDLAPATVSVIQVPAIRAGGSRAVNTDALGELVDDSVILTAVGIEAIVACRKASLAPTTTFGAGHVAADAANLGVDAAIVASPDAIGRTTDTLRDADVPYEVVEAP